MSTAPLVLHASCVALGERGVLILGKSGAGKSSLALQLMAFGAELVSDDRTVLHRLEDALIASAPDAITGVIEARGLGLLHAHVAVNIRVCLVVNLDQIETDRLPRHEMTDILGCSLPVVKRIDASHFVPALLQYLKAGALDPDDHYPSAGSRKE